MSSISKSQTKRSNRTPRREVVRKINTGAASKQLLILREDFVRIAEEMDLTSVGLNPDTSMWIEKDIEELRSHPEFKRLRQRYDVDIARRKVERAKNKLQLNSAFKDEEALTNEQVRLQLRKRVHKLDKVVLHLGPTNSGKTHQAVQELVRKASEGDWKAPGTGVYASPLRMLAHENYLRMKTLLGDDKVGLITGEESINPTAPVLSVTTEMVPMDSVYRDFLIVDEAHWMIDPDRGHVWTRALAAGNFHEIHVAAAAEVENVLRFIMKDCDDIQSINHERLAPLIYVDPVEVKNIPSRSAVVCFSRKSVYAIASRLMEAGHKVSVLYGALPPDVRRTQIGLFNNEQTDIIVTTDVIGHGVNLPIDHIIFAETMKFDGKEFRNLMLWEAGQIAGRAGRYGMTAQGTVGYLDAQPGMEPDAELIQQAVRVATGEERSDIDLLLAPVFPQLVELGEGTQSANLEMRLDRWHSLFNAGLGFAPAPMTTLFDRLTSLRPLNIRTDTKSNAGTIYTDIARLWKVLTLTVDIQSPCFPNMALAALLGDTGPLEANVESADNIVAFDIDILEQRVSVIRDVRAYVQSFGGFGDVDADKLARCESALAVEIDATLIQAVRDTQYGKCEDCGGWTAPWWRKCDDCRHGK